MIFQLISIACLVAFYGCYLLKMVLQKKQGIQTDQLGKGKTGTVKLVEITTKLAAISVLAAELASIFLDTYQAPFPLRIVGVILSVMGTILFIVAIWTMKDSWRAGVPEAGQTELVTDGIFQISRNPAFLGFDLLYTGTLFMFFNWILCAFTIVAIVMCHLQIVHVEEPFLDGAFGSAYLQYREKVCRYIGRK